MTMALERRYQDLKSQAESLEEGSPDKAAALYIDCASLLQALADATERRQLKDHYLQQTELLEERANQLKLHGGPSQRRDESKSISKDVVLVEKPKVRFQDIAGLTEAKERVREAIVYPFLYPEEYAYFGVKPGGGILVYGPPGCGKTMLAAAAAAECDAAFINLKVSDIKDMYVGESEKHIRQVFDLAREEDRAIIFFDEVDAVAPARSDAASGHERSLVAELLAQMDGIEVKGEERRVLVMAATNRPWDVDLALRRPGRFDTTIFVPHPDAEAREKLLQINLTEKPTDTSVDLGALTGMTEGLSSAEVVDICQRAARIPLRELIRDSRPRRSITFADFEKVLEDTRSMLGVWYRQAINEIEMMEDKELFQDLDRAGRDYAADR